MVTIFFLGTYYRAILKISAIVSTNFSKKSVLANKVLLYHVVQPTAIYH